MVGVAGHIVPAVGGLGLVPLERLGLGFWRADRIGVPGSADGGADVRLGDRRVDGAGGAGPVGQQPVVTGVARAGERAGDLTRVVHGRECVTGRAMVGRRGGTGLLGSRAGRSRAGGRGFRG